MKMHDRDIKNVEIFFDNNLSKDKNFKASISLESIKNISRYAKDTFIKWSSNKNNVQLIGGFVNTIFDEDKYTIELTKEEFLSKFSKDSVTLFNKIINNLDKDDVNEFTVKCFDNENRMYWFKCTIRRNESIVNDDFSYIGILSNITYEKLLEKEYNKVLDYDITIGMPNKKFIKNLVNNHLVKYEECEGLGALFLVDIDNFKFINDIFNHEIGDELLLKIADELKKRLDKKDIICRHSGDEFIIFKPCIVNIDEAENFAKKIIDIFDIPLYVEERELYVTASIGIAISPHNGRDFDVLLKSADTAMYYTKKNGKNGYTFFNNSISVELKRIYTLQRCLKEALVKNELFVLFQPNISLSDLKMHGMEALLRWNSKELGIVSPNEIIPIAESTRLILPIGRFVIEEVFKKVKKLLDDGYDDFKVAINLSELQLRYNTVINDFEDLLKKYKIPLKYIEVEITESILMKSFNKNVNILNAVKELGVSIALDDFGTGYSSLNYLTRLPIDILKIDRSFIVDILHNEKVRCIVENIIELSHKLGIEVIAEGVENFEQVKVLKEINCDKIQGYYFSKPDKLENIKILFDKKFSLIK